MVKNYMEELVDYWFDRILEENQDKYASLCRCPLCVAQMKVEALNRLKPFYVTRKSGEVFGEYKQKEVQYKMDIMVAITHAIETVGARAHRDAPHPQQMQALAGLRKRKEI